MFPGGSLKRVKGSNRQQVYFASHALQTFTPKTLKIYGRVLDENGANVIDKNGSAVTII